LNQIPLSTRSSQTAVQESPGCAAEAADEQGDRAAMRQPAGVGSTAGLPAGSTCVGDSGGVSAGEREKEKLGHVRTRRQADPDFRLRSSSAVVLEKPLPHVAGGHTNDRVIGGVVCGRPFEQAMPMLRLPQIPRIAVERLFDDVDQERLAARATLECRAFYDLIQVAKTSDSCSAASPI